MRIFRRGAVVGVALVTSVMALTACGGPGNSAGSDAVTGKVEGQVTFQTWNLKAHFKDYFEGVIADFEKKYPDAHVKWIDQPAEGYPDKLSADAAGGTLPDVVNVSPDLAYPLAKAGLALDLDKAAGRYRGEVPRGVSRRGVAQPADAGAAGGLRLPVVSEHRPDVLQQAALRAGRSRSGETSEDL